jgi:hypothetical protein
VYRREFDKGRKSLAVAVNGALVVDDETGMSSGWAGARAVADAS